MSTVNPSAVLEGAERVGATPVSSADPLTVADASVNPATEVDTVTSQDVPAARPETVMVDPTWVTVAPPVAVNEYVAVGS